MEKLKFKILTEDVEVRESINTAQQNIAEGIVNIIKENDQASTIGLQGPWGSGKSTIIKQVQNKFGNENDFIYFYFDAWAHEGDLLRKTFLVKLIDTTLISKINEVKENSKVYTKLCLIKNRILGIPTPSLFQIILVLSTLFVPFGTELISASKNDEFEFLNSTILILFFPAAYLYLIFKNLFEKSSQNISHLQKLYKIIPLFICCLLCIIPIYNYEFKSIVNTLNVIFAIGCILSLAPIIVILLYFVRVFENEKVYLKIQFEFLNTFFKNNTVESSSLDFERYFNEILGLFPQTKFIVVIDNLDRVDHDDAKKIWSTLQIFLQHRNPRSNSESIDYYKNLWLIIPHDHYSLMKIWDSNAIQNIENESLNKKDNLKMETYLEKCFQVRIDIPKMIMNDWVSIAYILIKSACPNITKSISEDIIYVMQKYRTKIMDNPNPRILKLYINQIGIYYTSLNSFFPEKPFPFKTLSFFIIQKYLENKNNDFILSNLINNSYQEEKFKYDLEDNYIESISCFSYFLNPEKALELLINNTISQALADSNHKELQKIETTFPTSFWFVFNNINKQNFEFLIYLPTIHKSFWNNPKFEKSKIDIISTILTIKSSGSKFLLLLANKKNSSEYYEALNCILDIYKNDPKESIELIKSIVDENKNIEINTSNHKVEIEWIKTLYYYVLDYANNNKINAKLIDISNFTFAMQFLKHWQKEHKDFISINESVHAKLLNLAETIPDEIFDDQFIDVFILKKYIEYCIHYKINVSEKIIIKILQNLENTMSNESISDNHEAVDILMTIFYSQKYNELLENHFKSFNLSLIISLLTLDKETSIKISFLHGMLSPGAFISPTEEQIEIENFWLKRDKLNAEGIVNLINKIEFNQYIKVKLWALMDNKYYLIVDILLSNNMNEKYYELDNVYFTLSKILKLHETTPKEKDLIFYNCVHHSTDINFGFKEFENYLKYPEVIIKIIDLFPLQNDEIKSFIRSEEYANKILQILKSEINIENYDILVKQKLIIDKIEIRKSFSILRNDPDLINDFRHNQSIEIDFRNLYNFFIDLIN